MHAVGQKRGEGERLGVPELDPALLERVAAARERLPQLAVDGEAVGHPQQRLVQLAQAIVGESRLDRRAAASVKLAGPGRRGVLKLALLDLAAKLLVAPPELMLALLGLRPDVVGRDD